jgi:predicted CoA-binding protein
VDDQLMTDDDVRSLLSDAKVIAVVGASSKPHRPSFGVAAYLQANGYRIVPVNPNETEVLGEPTFASLRDIPSDVHVGIVDVFRRSEHTPEIARQAVEIGARALWLQEDVWSDEAAAIARAGGLDVMMDACIKKVRHRLAIELGDER